MWTGLYQEQERHPQAKAKVMEKRQEKNFPSAGSISRFFGSL